MKLIAEYHDSDLNVITEKVGGKKNLVIEGVFMQADSKIETAEFMKKKF